MKSQAHPHPAGSAGRAESDAIVREFPLDGRSIVIDEARLLHVLGYPKSYMTEQLRRAIDHAKKKAAELSEPRCGFAVPDGVLSVADGRFLVRGVTFESGSIITAFLRRCSGVAFFTGTIGPRYERWIKECFSDGDPLLGMVSDVIASELAEATAEEAEARIVEHASRQGLRTTSRYSPGYCGWSVAEQQKLFSFLPPKFCGITLTESSLMIPIKSVSGVIGLGEKAVRQPYTCDACGMENCVYRKEKEASEL
jgi:hypothetical protein